MPIKDILTECANTFRQKTGVTNKLSIPEMTNLMASLKWGQSNLLKGTSDQYREVNTRTTDHDSWVQMTMSNGNPYHQFSQDIMDNAKYFTYSGTVENMTKYTIRVELIPINKDFQRLTDGVTSGAIYPGQKDHSFSITSPVPKNCSGFLADCFYYGVGNGQSFRMKEERLYVGTLPGIWTPNPADKLGGITRNILSGAPLNPDFFTGNKAVKLQNTTVYYEIHNGIHAMYNIDPIYAGKRFKITYWAKSDTPNAKIHFEPWGSDGAVDHQLTTEWQNFSDYAVLSTTAQQIYFWSKGDYTVELTDIIITIEK